MGRTAFCLLSALALLAAAGCGKTSASGGPGRAIFRSAGCGGCHALKAAGTSGTAGTNLDARKPSEALVIATVSKGLGSMPSYKGRLTEQQIKDVAAFVAAATR